MGIGKMRRMPLAAEDEMDQPVGRHGRAHAIRDLAQPRHADPVGFAQAQPVTTVLVDPVQRVVAEEIADFRMIERERRRLERIVTRMEERRRVVAQRSVPLPKRA